MLGDELNPPRRCRTFCDGESQHDATDGDHWHTRSLGLVSADENDLTDAPDPRNAPPFLVEINAFGDEPAHLGLAVAGYAAMATFSLAQARALRDLVVQAVELLEADPTTALTAAEVAS